MLDLQWARYRKGHDRSLVFDCTQTHGVQVFFKVTYGVTSEKWMGYDGCGFIHVAASSNSPVNNLSSGFLICP